MNTLLFLVKYNLLNRCHKFRLNRRTIESAEIYLQTHTKEIAEMKGGTLTQGDIPAAAVIAANFQVSKYV